MQNKNKPLAESWIGKEKEHRKSYRRKTIAPVEFLDQSPGDTGFLDNEESYVLDLSLDGAFIKHGDVPPMGALVNIKIVLPFGKHNAVNIGGRVTRTEDSGFGIEFNDLHYKDRSLIRSYVGFSELDDTVVSIQNSLKNILSGNMLPVTDPVIIHERLETARKNQLDCLILTSKKAKPISGTLDFCDQGIVLTNLDKKIPPKTRVVHVIIIDGPLHAIFEGLIHDPGPSPQLFYPDRMYLNDRRCSRRVPSTHEWMVLKASHLDSQQLAFSVLEKSEGGCSVLAPNNCLYTVGMRFPGFELKSDEGSESFDGATIARIKHMDESHLLLGLNYFDSVQTRDTFEHVSKKSLRTNLFNSAKRFSSLAIQKIKGAVGTPEVLDRERPYMVRYKNTSGDSVAALLDATFDLHAAPPSVDVAVVIAPPFPVRKEAFGLLARTLVDNFRHQGKSAVVLRFDLTHCLGESEVDPELEATGHPYLKWTYSNMVADISGSLNFLEKRFIPEKRSLITYSASAVAARKVIAEQKSAKVDHWIAPFGCPDGQDMLKNLLAGVDLVEAYHRGEPMEPFLIYGRFFDPNASVPDAIKNKMTRLEDSRIDMGKINIPVTWIIGTYDYMVSQGRVKEMFNASGGGVREIIELPTGHNPKTGAEAIESFKLICESMSKHLFHTSVQAIEPDLARFNKQNTAEWARSRTNKKRNMEKFWEEHLFGTSTDKEGYDVLLYSPDYVEFIGKHVDLLDLKPDLRVADFGCGTGNFSAAILESLSTTGTQFELSCFDLVKAAVERTQAKLEGIMGAFPEKGLNPIKTSYRTLDLETARMQSLKEFLDGKLYSIKSLQGRIEGLNASTLKKLDEGYTQDIHDVLHGKPSTVFECKKLCPALDKDEAEEFLELSRASRFLKDSLLPDDMLTPDRSETAKDLHFDHLVFGMTPRTTQIDCPSNAFDRIGASLVIPYLFDPESVLKEFYRILDHGGILVLSNLKPNSEGSKAYYDHAQAIVKRTDLDKEERDHLLNSLREFSAFMSRLVELEDEGRFRFYPTDELILLVKKAGFSNISFIESLGDPASAIIIRAEKA
ncbi:hypothetical protein DSLASN_30670 [Desulfoluna limicola]|uniref:PilZ domain-containing protein n=1 Tax=Desulfoluna limicola TaxID=2810562 RepID=A0ABN6F715_9BACT|nr:PilZ domain-containing protein [Desulfoluna limicola]BCS97435.1 hypothetical protein DSLASN_30670 [Desulfoluna limicola]